MGEQGPRPVPAGPAGPAHGAHTPPQRHSAILLFLRLRCQRWPPAQPRRGGLPGRPPPKHGAAMPASALSSLSSSSALASPLDIVVGINRNGIPTMITPMMQIPRITVIAPVMASMISMMKRPLRPSLRHGCTKRSLPWRNMQALPSSSLHSIHS